VRIVVFRLQATGYRLQATGIYLDYFTIPDLMPLIKNANIKL